MTHPFDTPEHQELVARAHALVAAIASRPGSIKLLQGIVSTLELYAGYKLNRQRRYRNDVKPNL